MRSTDRVAILRHFKYDAGGFMRTVRAFVAIALLATGVRPVQAQLTASTSIIELGVIRGGQRIEHRFELINPSAEPIEVFDLQRGCGCLAPRLEQRIVPACGKTGLVAELRTLGQANGEHTWNLQVHYRRGRDANGQDAKVLPLTLRGTVKNDITVQPAILGMHVAKAVEQEITLTDHRAAPLRVIDAEARGAGVRVTKIERAGKITKVLVSADATQLDPGRHEGRLTITTDDPDYGQLQVPIVVTKATATTIQAAPESVILRFAAGVTSASALVRVRAPGDQAVRISKIEPSDPALVCTWAPGPGNDATLKIQVRAALSSSFRSHVEVHLAAPTIEVLTIPVAMQ